MTLSFDHGASAGHEPSGDSEVLACVRFFVDRLRKVLYGSCGVGVARCVFVGQKPSENCVFYGLALRGVGVLRRYGALPHTPEPALHRFTMHQGFALG